LYCSSLTPLVHFAFWIELFLMYNICDTVCWSVAKYCVTELCRIFKYWQISLKHKF
jgi:hypothetical protein